MALTFLKRFVPNTTDLAHTLAYKMACFLSTGLGLGGTTYISAGETKEGVFNVIHSWEDCVFSAVEFAEGSTSGTFVGKTLLAGDREYGHFRSLTLASGFATLSHSSQALTR